MSTGMLLLVALALFLLCNLLVNGLILWLGCRWCRVAGPQTQPTLARPVTYRRAMAVAVLLYVLHLALFVPLLVFTGDAALESKGIQLATLGLGLGVALLCIGLIFRAPPGKAVLVTLLWAVLGGGAAYGSFTAFKSTLAEPFIVPTGAMAETIRGYHKVVPCPRCRHEFPVNASREADPQGGPPMRVEKATCPNCRYAISFREEKLDPPVRTGDRVVVGKRLFGARLLPPARFDLAAFYYPPRAAEPKEPPIIYLKRVVALPGETLAIHHGDLWTLSTLKYEKRPRPENAEQLWKSEYIYEDDEEAVKLFSQGKFQVLRKPPELLLALRRLVHDNEYQDPNGPRRWVPEKPDNGWTADRAEQPRRFTPSTRPGDDLAWLRYRHILEKDGKPSLVTDFLGYNTHHGYTPEHWVGDLMLECDVEIERPAGQLVLELTRGVDRFQARFALDAGTCALVRLGQRGEEELARKDAPLRAGKHRLRFANFDERLTVWVGDVLPFGEGVAYSPPPRRGPTANDLQPVGIAAQGARLSLTGLKVCRDTYYTSSAGQADTREIWKGDDPETWNALRALPVKTFYVQPDHFFLLGDNSPESSDSRVWGLVPERLLMGKVLWRYFPLNRAGAVH